MVNILPFKKTGQLVSEIDEYIDKISEAQMVLERSLYHYFEHGPDEELDLKVEQIMTIEARADELRRNITIIIYTEMLMPDTRGDVLSILGEVDTTLDDCVHLLVSLSLERPGTKEDGAYQDGFKTIISEAGKAVQAMLQGVRAYFKEPNTVRDYVHKISFHEREAMMTVLRTGRAIFDSDMPLVEKREVRDWLMGIRNLATHASDVGDQLVIFAVKRSI
jgi:predicted phosphate transport protein (TIGR00153 family)